MRTARAATLPSQRIKSAFEPGWHYAKAQKTGGNYFDDNLTPLLDELDSTGKPAYQVVFDGEKTEDRRVTKHSNAVIIRCRSEYADAVQKANSSASLAAKNFRPSAPLGTQYEDRSVEAVRDLTPISFDQAQNQAEMVEAQRVHVTEAERQALQAAANEGLV